MFTNNNIRFKIIVKMVFVMERQINHQIDTNIFECVAKLSILES